MAQQQDVDDLKALCSSGLAVPIEKLVARPKWGDINFEAARPSFESAFYLFNAFSTLPLNIVPDGQLNQIVASARAVVNRLREINSFNLDGGENPKGRSSTLIQSLRGEVDQFVLLSSPCLPFLAYYRGDIQAQLAQIEEGVAKASKLYDDGIVSIDGKKKQVDDAVNAARIAAAEAGAAVFTQDFLAEAKKIEKSAMIWLGVAAFCSVSALAVAVVAFFFFLPPPDASVPYVIQHTVTKLVVVGGLITAAIWCGSMYRALRHQAAINKHRGNALKTFQAFVEAAGDRQEIKDAVLLETTRSIFAVAPTGFLNATETNVDGGPKIADTLKAFGRAS